LGSPQAESKRFVHTHARQVHLHPPGWGPTPRPPKLLGQPHLQTQAHRFVRGPHCVKQAHRPGPHQPAPRLPLQQTRRVLHFEPPQEAPSLQEAAHQALDPNRPVLPHGSFRVPYWGLLPRELQQGLHLLQVLQAREQHGHADRRPHAPARRARELLPLHHRQRNGVAHQQGLQLGDGPAHGRPLRRVPPLKRQEVWGGGERAALVHQKVRLAVLGQEVQIGPHAPDVRVELRHLGVERGRRRQLSGGSGGGGGGRCQRRLAFSQQLEHGPPVVEHCKRLLVLVATAATALISHVVTAANTPYSLLLRGREVFPFFESAPGVQVQYTTSAAHRGVSWVRLLGKPFPP